MIVMLLDNHYGPDRRVEFEASILSEAGSDVRVVAWDRRADVSEQAEGPAGVEVERVSLAASRGLGWRSLGHLARFCGRVWRERGRLLAGAQVVVVHDLYLLPFGVALRRALGIQLVYDAHEDWAVMEANRYPKPLLNTVTAVETFLARRAAVVVVPGESRAPRWRDVGVNPVVLRNLGSETPAPEASAAPAYDVAYAGSLLPARRVDLLLELAERRPDLRIAIAGEGRTSDLVRERAEALPNVEFRGWESQPDALYAASRVIYYGLDPDVPYSTKACPNTLYMAIQARRPLVFFCGGEPEVLLRSHRIGLRAEPSVDGLERAVDQALAPAEGWEFDDAWRAVEPEAARRRYVSAVQSVAREAT